MRRASAALFLVTIFFWAVQPAPSCSAAEPPPPEPPKTLEEQLKYLEGALAEALRVEDWAMLELAADGLAKAKLAPDARELLALRAERQAALELLDQWTGGRGEQRARIETWGLAARALAGDKDSLEQLRKLATTPPAEPAPAPAAAAKGGMARMQEMQQQALAQQRREQAVLCLALLKDPGALEKVKACLDALKAPQAAAGRTFGMRATWTSPALVLAALVAGGDEGWKALLAYCADKDTPADRKVFVFQAMQNTHRILNDEQWQKRQPFALVVQVKPKLPESAGQDLSKAYVEMIKACDGKDFNAAQMLLQLNYGMKPDEDGLAALKDLRERLTCQNSDYLKTQIDHWLKTDTKPNPTPTGKPEKPPQAPEGF